MITGQADSINGRILPIISPLKKQQSREEEIIIPVLEASLTFPMLPMKNPNPIPIMHPIKEVNKIHGSDAPNSIFNTKNKYSMLTATQKNCVIRQERSCAVTEINLPFGEIHFFAPSGERFAWLLMAICDPAKEVNRHAMAIKLK